MQCRGKLARRWEMDLRKEIFWGEVMGDDKPVEPYFDVPYTVSPDDWGLQAVYHKTDASGSYVWDGADQGLRHRPEEAPLARGSRSTGRRPTAAWRSPRTCLGDLLTVRLKGTWWWSLGLTWPAATFRGLQNMLCDFVEHPDELKELLSHHLAGLPRQARLPGSQPSAEPEQRRHLRRLRAGSASPTSCRSRTSPGHVRCLRHVGLHREPGDGPRLAGDVRGVRLPLREADHGPFRADLLRLLRAAARAVARRSSGITTCAASPARRGSNVEKMAELPGRQVHLLAEAQPGRPGRARNSNDGGDPQRAPREPWRRPGAASSKSS